MIDIALAASCKESFVDRQGPPWELQRL